MKTTSMHGAPLGYKIPHPSGAVGTACLPHSLPLSPVMAGDSLGWGAVAYSLGRKWDVFFWGS